MISEFNVQNKLSLPNPISLNINQRTEKIKSSTAENIDVPTTKDEITKEQIIPNEALRKDNIKPYIIKE